MCRLIFFSVAFFGTMYFLLNRRKLDYFTVAFFSACIYFLPGFFGYTTYHTGGAWTETAINDETYLIMSSVLASMLLMANLGASVKNPITFAFSIPNTHLIANTLCALSIFGLVALVLSAGSAIHDSDKDSVMEHLGRWHILFYSAAVIGLPLSFALKRIGLFFAFVSLLIFDLYLGFRSAMAMGFLSTAIIYLATKPKSRLLTKEFRPLFAIVLLAVFFFLYKAIAFSIKSGNWELVFNALLDTQTYELMITRSEPFVIQQILNDVVKSDFQIPIGNIFSAFGQFIIFAPELGISSSSFNDLFQPTLFPSVEYGMAANIWAQMWSAGGWGLLSVFLLIFNIVLTIGNASLRSPSIVIRAGFAPIFLYWAFYIHRNDISYAINIEKRLLIILLTCIALAYLLSLLSQDTKLNKKRQADV